MSFDTDEKSVQGSRPRELWKITSTASSYYITPQETDYVFSLDSQTYEAVPGARAALAGASTEDAPEMVLELPADHDLVQENAFGIPSSNMRLIIYRVQTGGAYLVWWDGEITGFSIEGKLAKLRSPSVLGDALDAPIPCLSVQRVCNHVLYDARCTIDRTSYRWATQADSISGKNVSVVSLGHGDQWARNGEIERVSDGERRLILDQIGTDLILNAPFRDLDVGDDVYVFAGCSRALDDTHGCVTKFSNAVNFGGFPNTTPVNPFRGDIRGYPWRR